jgi:TPR repeat protein
VGDKEAQFVMGELLFEGMGFTRNVKKAIEWFELSRKQYQLKFHKQFYG